ncbi:MAG: 50S ribosomal protein L9 [Candidatus Ancillula sp.]|jgi:large subunit ribosomal protein L9|nr:50S ribosomal protein L9 [Candidatus Ancillula sp.]
MTKIILNQTVAKLGVAGDVVDVKPGYARNFLLPQNHAILWSKRAGEQVELRRASARRKAIASIDSAKSLKAKLEGAVLLVPVKAGNTGKLYGAVTGASIADAIKDTYGETIDKRKVVIDGHIKTTGHASVKVHLLDDVDAVVKINVTASKK